MVFEFKQRATEYATRLSGESPIGSIFIQDNDNKYLLEGLEIYEGKILKMTCSHPKESMKKQGVSFGVNRQFNNYESLKKYITQILGENNLSDFDTHVRIVNETEYEGVAERYSEIQKAHRTGLVKCCECENGTCRRFNT